MPRISRPSAGGLLLLGLLASGFLLDGRRLGPLPHGQKPMFPVLARIELLNLPRPGEVARVLASVTAWAPGEDVSLDITLPDGVALLSGTTAWSGQLNRGETRAFELAVQVPDGRLHELTARARIIDQPRATSAATLPIELGPPVGPRATMRVVESEGATYIQYQGEVRPRGEGEK